MSNGFSAAVADAYSDDEARPFDIGNGEQVAAAACIRRTPQESGVYVCGTLPTAGTTIVGNLIENNNIAAVPSRNTGFQTGLGSGVILAGTTNNIVERNTIVGNERAGVIVQDDVAFDLGLNQTELAQWCGVSREAVVKALARLRALGWIATDGSRVTVLDGTALVTRAQH